MDKSKFLRGEYDRIISSGDFVWSVWRESFERFEADLWDRTPTYGGERRLGVIDKYLGYSRDNVEWQFPRVKKIAKPKAAAAVTAKPMKPIKPKPLTAAQKKARLQAEKQAKREALAAEFLRWDTKRAG